MTKVQEKAMEKYLSLGDWCGFSDNNLEYRIGYMEGFKEALEDFTKKIKDNTVDIPPEIQKVIDDYFEEML